MAFSTAWRRLVGAAATGTLALLALAVLVSPARAATGEDLSGQWLNAGYTLSSYQLHMSADRRTLSATWGADVGNIQEGLVGRFTGALNSSGTAFTGPMHVTVGSIRVSGSMTVTMSSQQKFGYPLLDVSYLQDNGVGANFVLEIWLMPPKLSPGSHPSASFEFACPGPRACRDTAEAQASGVGGSPTVGFVGFTIEPGRTRTIRVSLTRTGRALLAKRHALSVRLVVTALEKSSPLPATAKLGPVTFHAA